MVTANSLQPPERERTASPPASHGAKPERAASARPRKPSSIVRLIKFALIVGVSAGAGWALRNAKLEHEKHEKEQLPPAVASNRDPAQICVTVASATRRPVQREIEAVGTLHGFEEIPISAKVEGRVNKLHFDMSDRVKPGDVLLEIDPTDFELSRRRSAWELQVEVAKLGLTELPRGDVDLSKVPTVMQALSRKENATKRLDRIKPLVVSKAVSVEEGDSAANDVRVAEAEYANQQLIAQAGLATIKLKQSALAVAQQQLVDSQVRVPTPSQPIPGMGQGVNYAVMSRAVSEGALVRPGTEIGKLVITETLKLRVPVPERHCAEVQLGQTVDVSLAAFPTPFTGTVTRINPAVDSTTRTFDVEIQVPNPNADLKPGSFAKVRIQTRMDNEAATVPLSALVNFAGINKLFVIENGRAREIPVTTGVQTTDWVEITSPRLPPDAQIITSGQSLLAAESPVSIRAEMEPIRQAARPTELR
jgi:RND family efflux transporter MFP subunit